MTDKEHLKGVKRLIENYENCCNKDFALKYAVDLMRHHARYFIEQAERVQELEEERNEWKDTAQSYYMTNQELRKQNKQYREALEFYAEDDNYGYEVSYRPQPEIGCMVLDDRGYTSRQALEGEE